MRDRPYKRLTVSRITSFATTKSLWLGADHLLLVTNSGYTEFYKRFYFRDIQAVTVMETGRRAVWNAVLGFPFGICLLGTVSAVISHGDNGTLLTWSIIGLVFLVPLVINNIRGTACKCELRTAVQTESLGSLSRVRQTGKVLDKIRPLIATVQGQLTPEEIPARMHAAAVEELPSPKPPPPAAPPVVS